MAQRRPNLFIVGAPRCGTTSLHAFLEGHEDIVFSLAALDGGRLESGSYHRTVKVWDIATGECVTTLEGHRATVTALAVGPGPRGRHGAVGP